MTLRCQWLSSITVMLCIIPLVGFSESTLLFQSGFEKDTYIADGMLDIHGIDKSTGFDWDATPTWIDSTRFVYLVNRDKNLSDFMETEIIEAVGPYDNKTKVLHFQSKADDPDHGSTSRSEYSLFGKKPPHNYQEGFCRYWMKLQSDLPKRIPYEKGSPWYMIMEWKEPNSGIKKSAEECKKLGGTKGGSNNYRININIKKDANSSDFYWQIIGQHPQPCRVTEWSFDNRSVEVPFGKWFLVEAYMKQHKTDGRVFFAVNGEVVLDTNNTNPEGFDGRTQHKDNPMPLRFWSIFKIYHNKEWYKKGPTNQWYDDVELWSSFPPGHYANQ
jgi:hypothetical protein